jgi:hypothetical protein
MTKSKERFERWTNWIDQLAESTAPYNYSYHSTIGISSYFALFSKEPQIHIKSLPNVIKANSDKKKIEQKISYENTKSITTFSPGEVVYLKKNSILTIFDLIES